MTTPLAGLHPHAAQRVVAAGQALDAGRVDEASAHLASIPAAEAGHPDVLRMQAGVLGMHGQHQEALRTMRRALAQRPGDPAYHNTLGTLLGNAGEFDAAVDALRAACELQPTMALAWYNLGVMLTRCVRNDEAVAALQLAVSLDRNHMSARALLADMLRMRGRAEEAATEYRRVLAGQPYAGMAWWGLADLKTIRFAPGDIDRMQAALRDPRAGDDDLIATGFALAKALDDADRPAEALAALHHANTLARRRQQWNRSAFSAGVSAINEAFAQAPQSTPSALGSEVIFIVGLPRSGSTLVEHILASHSRVEGAGELPDLPLVLAEESRRRGQPFAHWIAAMRPADWERLGERYLERTAHWRRERPQFTDKLPSNWMYIGAIRSMLPGARIIGCHRDPLETCFSCYRQRLDNNEYTRSFLDLATFWRDYQRSVGQWRERYPDRIFEHRYEELVAEPAAQIAKLLKFCGLPYEETCLAFHRNPREVRSPSASQVRQPLRGDTARAPRYGALLDPLRAALDLQPWSS